MAAACNTTGGLAPRTPAKSNLSNAASTSKTPAKTPKTPGAQAYSDRFIPNREAHSASQAASLLRAGLDENSVPEGQNSFNTQLAQSLFNGDDCTSKILAFKSKAPAPAPSHTNSMRVLYTSNRSVNNLTSASNARSSFRSIATTAEKVLDAPDLLDDYYLNLLQWGPNNIVAIALGKSVYLWHASTGGITQLCEAGGDPTNHVTSVSWMQDGSHLAVATSSNNDVQMWNVESGRQVRSMKGHAARVGALAWNQHILSSGSRDASIFHHDVRAPNHHVATLLGHQQEVCGLTWSPDGSQLASGGNDNMCAIWDVAATTPTLSFRDSAAAVKALAWCPWQRGLLATGSGTADRHMRFYNTNTMGSSGNGSSGVGGSLLHSIDTQSQVCSLVWSQSDREILSSHGFSQNQLSVWKYPSLVKLADLNGHQARVLHTSLSPDGTTVCSAAADETIRFWKVWDKKDESRSAGIHGNVVSTKNGKLERVPTMSSSRFIR